MSALLSNLAAIFIAIPLLGYLIIFVITKLLIKKHRKSVKIASDLSTILFIISVYCLLSVIWDIKILWHLLIIILLFVAALLIARLQFYGERMSPRFFRVFWRSSFLVFVSAYFLLLLIGLVKSIVHAL